MFVFGMGKPNELEAFKNKLKDDEVFLIDIAGRLLMILNRLDAVEKARVVGKAMAYYIDAKFDYEIFKEICHAIDKCFYDDLVKLKERTKEYQYGGMVHLNQDCKDQV